jgi:16S rRNA (cytosine967-C5)-methyltransferase
VEIVQAFLAASSSFRRLPILADEVHGQAEWLTSDGDLRTLPCHLLDPDSRMAGLDGFYAARLQRM